MLSMQFWNAPIILKLFFQGIGFSVIDFFNLSEVLYVHFLPHFVGNQAITEVKSHADAFIIYIAKYIFFQILFQNFEPQK